MRLWIFIIFVFIVQEFVSTNTVLFEVRQYHYNIWLVHLIFILATLFDIWLGYFLGKWLQKTLKQNRLMVWTSKWANKINNFMGKKGNRFSLILLGASNYPYLDSFLVSWLEVPLKDVFLYLLIGELIWYAIEWLFVLGIKTIVPNPYEAVYILIGASILLSIIIRLASKKLANRF